MKKILLLIPLCLLLLFSVGYAQNKKVAVVTFYAVKQLGISELGSAAAIASVAKLSKDPDFNMIPLLNNFHTQFFENYSKDFPFQLLPEDQVVSNYAYKAFMPVGSGTGLLADSTNTPFNGYKVAIPLAGHPNEKSLLSIFPQCDGVITVFINFDLAKTGFAGMGIVRINAHANITLFNKNGDQVFSIKEDAKSKMMNPLVAGVPVMTPDKILPMCESATTELMAALQKDLPRLIKKSDAKL